MPQWELLRVQGHGSRGAVTGVFLCRGGGLGVRSQVRVLGGLGGLVVRGLGCGGKALEGGGGAGSSRQGRSHTSRL